MRENYEAIGFIPLPTIIHRYVARDRYVLQHDERGRRIGYLLYGAFQYGRPVTIAQHCIQYDSRLHGYGEGALNTLIDRASHAGVSAVLLRCATDLEALHFWRAQGFSLIEAVPGGKQRGRTIARLWLPLALPLWSDQ